MKLSIRQYKLKYISILFFLLSAVHVSWAKTGAEISLICIDDGINCSVMSKLITNYKKQVNEKAEFVLIPKEKSWIINSLPIELEAGIEYDVVVTSAPKDLQAWFLDMSRYRNFSNWYEVFSRKNNEFFIHDEKKIAGFILGVNYHLPFVNKFILDGINYNSNTSSSITKFLEDIDREAFDRGLKYNIIINSLNDSWLSLSMSYKADFYDNYNNININNTGFTIFLNNLKDWRARGLVAPVSFNSKDNIYTLIKSFLDEEAAMVYVSAAYAKILQENTSAAWRTIPLYCLASNCTHLADIKAIVALAYTKRPYEVSSFIKWLADYNQQVFYAKESYAIATNNDVVKNKNFYQGLPANIKHIMDIQYDLFQQNDHIILEIINNKHYTDLNNSINNVINKGYGYTRTPQQIKDINNEFNRRKKGR